MKSLLSKKFGGELGPRPTKGHHPVGSMLSEQLELRHGFLPNVLPERGLHPLVQALLQ